MRNYIKVVFYSEDDEGFIAVAPELLGCSAFGETEEEALGELRVAIDLHLEVRRAEGRERLSSERALECSIYTSARGDMEKELVYEKNYAFSNAVYS